MCITCVMVLKMLQLLLRPDLNEVVILTKVCAEDKILLSNALLQIFRMDRQEAHLLRTFNDLQIDEEGKEIFMEI